jgi:light-regulated signal transduction histidine kinase (bacteriophytochrome)
MQNLIGNGVKYHGYDPPQVHASAKPNGSNWTIAVRDNGIGVAPEHHEKIFEIFHRLHTQQAYPGTGIGLAICRQIVKRHGGTIWLESQPGKGSTFYFTLGGATS